MQFSFSRRGIYQAQDIQRLAACCEAEEQTAIPNALERSLFSFIIVCLPMCEFINWGGGWVLPFLSAPPLPLLTAL
ncbi:hypothetical protein SRHO_G00124350 [Serrasalmus rhombeus]